jgi:steroid 5-alpha reductase family enzyme
MMKKENVTAVISMPIVILIGLGIAWAGSQGGHTAFGIPIFALAVALAFIINWLVFIPSYFSQTEKYFDLTGSFTYISVALMVFLLSPEMNWRSILLMVLVVIWAARLGSFLFRRIHKAGKDDRFDEIKKSFPRFLLTWSLQGLWVTFTAATAFAAISSNGNNDFGIFAITGLLIWIFGFMFEVIADAQKSRFKANPENNGKFISSGLWAWSRHPNYFGEITLWIGVALIAFPVLQGWQYVTLISPVFVALLLIKISGIPMLEEKADKKWGGQEDYERYKKNTPALVPWKSKLGK